MKRSTRQGELILDVIRNAGRPLTPLEIHQIANRAIPRLGIATTYRHLKTLSENHQVVGVETVWTRYIFPAVPVISYSHWKTPLKIIHPRKFRMDLRLRALKSCFTEPVRNADKGNSQKENFSPA